MIPTLRTIIASGSPGIVTLTNSNASVTDAASPYDSTASFRLNGDGTVDKRQTINGANVFTQINSLTDWIIPNSKSANRTWHVRYNYAGTALTVGSDSINAWIPLGASRTWTITSTAFEIISGGGTMLISDDGGATTLASAQFDLDIANI